MSRMKARNTMSALNLIRIFEIQKIVVPARTGFRAKNSLDNFKNSADISVNSENASIISPGELEKLNEEYSFFQSLRVWNRIYT